MSAEDRRKRVLQRHKGSEKAADMMQVGERNIVRITVRLFEGVRVRARRGRGGGDHQHGGDRGHEQGPGGGQGQGGPAAVLGIIIIDCIPS